MYDKASIALIPSGYKAGSTDNLYSVLPANGDGDFNATRGSIATRVNKDGLIETVATNVPRLDYPLIDGVVQDCPALLLEPSRTNSLPYSNDFTNAAWNTASSGTGSAATVTGNYAISPDGSQNASRLQISKGSGTTSSDYSAFQDDFSTISTASLSIWMKSNDSNTYSVALRSSNYIVCSVTPEWQRFELNNQSNIVLFQLILRGGYGTSDSADILIYGSQAENGSYTTSYIPTNGETNGVTRSADVCNSAGTSTEFNDSEGVLFAEIQALADDGSLRLIQINDGSTVNNMVTLGYNSAFGQLLVQIRSGGGTTNVFTHNITDVTLYNKLALKYEQNTATLYVNGFEAFSSSITATPIGLSELDFDYNGGFPFYGKVKQLIYFNEALSDSELQTLTS